MSGASDPGAEVADRPVLLQFDERFEGPVDVSTVFDGSFVDGLYDEDGELK